jgi:hypothetical protein
MLLGTLASAFPASVIGNWNGSQRSWKNAEFSVVRDSVTAAGHTVENEESITALNLLNDTHFIIGEASLTPSVAEITTLSSWVHGGGVLLVFSDSGGDGFAGGNAILSGIGSAMNFGGSPPIVAPFVGGNFASVGPPYDIVGQTLTVSPGNEVSGGNILAGSYVHYEHLGSGWAFAFGDRLDHNFFLPNNSTVNGQLFLNITAVPEPSTLALILFSALLGLVKVKSS